MARIQINNLSQTGNEEILHCFNTAFSDYLVPLQLSREQLETKLYSESIDKAISVGAFKGDKLIGLVLHGRRTIDGVQVAYNAGTGVIPDERGHGITQKMYGFIQPILKQGGCKEVVLEVISTNMPAIISYGKIGFKEIRHLSCFKGIPKIPKVHGNIRIEEAKQMDFDSLSNFGEIRPTWQNSKETILRLGDGVCYFLAFVGDDLCGYGVLNLMNNRILQIAVKQECRNSTIGTSLLNAIKRKISEPISIINVDDGFKSTINFFENRGMEKTLGQIEMKLQIGDN